MTSDASGHASAVDPHRAEWLRRLAAAARAASDQLRALDDPLLHGALIDDLNAFRDRIVSELEAVRETRRDVEQ